MAELGRPASRQLDVMATYLATKDAAQTAQWTLNFSYENTGL